MKSLLFLLSLVPCFAEHTFYYQGQAAGTYVAEIAVFHPASGAPDVVVWMSTAGNSNNGNNRYTIPELGSCTLNLYPAAFTVANHGPITIDVREGYLSFLNQATSVNGSAITWVDYAENGTPADLWEVFTYGFWTVLTLGFIAFLFHLARALGRQNNLPL